jgi:hypothetical protein
MSTRTPEATVSLVLVTRPGYDARDPAPAHFPGQSLASSSLPIQRSFRTSLSSSRLAGSSTVSGRAKTLGIAACIASSVLLKALIAAGRLVSAYLRGNQEEPEQDAQRDAEAMKELVV